METLKLKNYTLETLAKVVDYPMAFQRGRVKNRFMKIVIEKLQAVEKNRIEIIKELAEKDKDGEPIIEENAYKLSDENKVKWQKEYQKLMSEDCIIDLVPSLKVDIGEIKSIINNSSVVLDSMQTAIIEEIVTALENTKTPK